MRANLRLRESKARLWASPSISPEFSLFLRQVASVRLKVRLLDLLKGKKGKDSIFSGFVSRWRFIFHSLARLDNKSGDSVEVMIVLVPPGFLGFRVWIYPKTLPEMIRDKICIGRWSFFLRRPTIIGSRCQFALCHWLPLVVQILAVSFQVRRHAT